ncbi:MAG: hypothetical protein KAV00_17015 [Phycisphaerae bacterium]|nr:hypothetical protein [Phycisphaerae bacterium]
MTKEQAKKRAVKAVQLIVKAARDLTEAERELARKRKQGRKGASDEH